MGGNKKKTRGHVRNKNEQSTVPVVYRTYTVDRPSMSHYRGRLINGTLAEGFSYRGFGMKFWAWQDIQSRPAKTDGRGRFARPKISGTGSFCFLLNNLEEERKQKRAVSTGSFFSFKCHTERTRFERQLMANKQLHGKTLTARSYRSGPLNIWYKRFGWATQKKKN